MEDVGRASGSSDFGALLRSYRLRAGLSQESLAERARMSTNGIGALERGYRRSPQRETLALLAGALALDDGQRREFEEAAARSGSSRRPGGATVAVGPWPSNGGSFLPLALTSFVGREAELDQIAALVRDHRLVTLTGAGGIGKTQTALQVGAARTAADEPVCFVGLATVSSLASVLTAIGLALGVQEAPNRPLRETLVAYLKERSLLLILDNCEHVIAESATVVAALLAGCPQVRILATSREPLRASGERTYLLPSLAAYGAIELFTDRARAIDYGFALTDENTPTVAELCRRLDGIPLAIELAAARVKVLSPQQLVQRLDERFRVLTGGERTALPRHQTMRALIDWSYDLLSEPERTLFRKLSVFAGGFTLETAAAVCADDTNDEFAVLDLLSSLVDKSLVQADPTVDARYRQLESTREYARQKLGDHGEHEAAVRAHATVFAGMAEELERTFDVTPDHEWYAQAEPELENWRVALEWALKSRGDVVLGQRLAGALRQVWVLLAAEGRRWVCAALDSADARTPAPIVARLELSEALFDSALVQHKACSESAARALAHYRKLDDPRGIATAQRFLGRALVFLGKIAEGEKLLRESLAAFRSLGARKLTGSVLEDLGIARQQAGDLDEARALYADGLTIFKDSGAERSAANVAINLAELEFRAGDVPAALRLANEALAVNRAANFTLMVAHDLSNAAAYLIALERYDEARSHAREALMIAQGAYIEVVVAWTFQHLAAVAALRPSADDAGADSRDRAARLLGYVDARFTALEAVLEFTERQEYDKACAALHDAFGSEECAALMNEGRAWTEDQAMSEALLV
jgi:predicted ATPase/transcriptional regulator with XRE-family HTH domain